ncbi:hypothetical protein HPB51_027368 [Rhipicephalus microplus]|uniref:DUF4371 domain-containing protein n=1 Tax=Rhipicephalus microplus TaxID=6941 RepID=A0A9J6D0A2_RHIMP|nr:hypothetical protein HPB51_027368 [Rhipicephalus microplus]
MSVYPGTRRRTVMSNKARAPARKIDRPVIARSPSVGIEGSSPCGRQLLDTETRTGIFLPPKLVQGTLDFSNGSANTSLEHQVSKAETTFALSVVAKGIPFSWGDTATSIYRCMLPDSDIAKKFSCGRIKLARIVSDGLGPYFKGQVVTELCQPNVYFSIMIDETPKPELRVQQLDVLVRYFSSSQQEVVVEHVQSFDLGHATAEIIVGCIEEAIADLPKQGLVCFFSDGPNVMKSVRNKLQKHVAPSLILATAIFIRFIMHLAEAWMHLA